MNVTKKQLWKRFQEYYTGFPSLGLAIDISRMTFGEDCLAGVEPRMRRTVIATDEAENGGLANPYEKRMVGQYWLGNPPLAASATYGERPKRR